MLVKGRGHAAGGEKDVDPFDFIPHARRGADHDAEVARAPVRRAEAMNEQMQALAFMAGANSIFYGEKLLTTGNPQADKDMQLFARLGIKPEERRSTPTKCIRRLSGRPWSSSATPSCSTTPRRSEYPSPSGEKVASAG